MMLYISHLHMVGLPRNRNGQTAAVVVLPWLLLLPHGDMSLVDVSMVERVQGYSQDVIIGQAV